MKKNRRFDRAEAYGSFYGLLTAIILIAVFIVYRNLDDMTLIEWFNYQRTYSVLFRLKLAALTIAALLPPAWVCIKRMLFPYW